MRVTVHVERDVPRPVSAQWSMEPKRAPEVEVVVDLTGEFSPLMTAQVLRAVADSIYKDAVR